MAEQNEMETIPTPVGEEEVVEVEAPAASAKSAEEQEQSKVEADVTQEDGDDVKGESETGQNGGAKADELVFVPKPDREVRDAKLDELKARLEKLQKDREKLQNRLNTLQEKNAPSRSRKTSLRQQISQLQQERSKVYTERGKLMEKQKAIANAIKAQKEELRKMREGIKYSKVEDVDREIQKLENRQATESMTLKQEKDLLKEITQLKAIRRKLEEYQAKASGAAANESKMNEKQDVQTQIKSLKEKLDVITDQLSAKREELKTLTEESGTEQAAVEGVKKSLDEIWEKTKEIHTERRQVNDQWKKDNDAHYAYKKALYQQRKEEQRKREEEERKRREELQRKREEEEMKKKPWEEEIALCDFLTAYLVRIQKEYDDAQIAGGKGSSGEDASGKNTGPVLEGLQPMKKKADIEDNFMVMGSAKSKRSRKKKVDERITHSLDTLSSFQLLSLEAPNKYTEIPQSLQQLKEKRDYYDVLPRDALKKQPKAASADASQTDEDNPRMGSSSKSGNKKRSNKTKTVAPSMESSDLFPMLPGSKSPKSKPATPTSNGPSAVELVKNSNGVSPSDSGVLQDAARAPLAQTE